MIKLLGDSPNVIHKIVRAIQEFYMDTKLRIKVVDKVTNGFVAGKDVKQGCCLSPALCKIYIGSH